MTSDSGWIELQISVLELGPQRARVRVQMTPPDLIAGVLREFKDSLPFLTDRPTDYELRVGQGGAALTDTIELGHQVSAGVQIALVERALPLPRGARPVMQPAFVRNTRTGRVTRVSWQPAIIGRPQPERDDNALLAIDLTAEPNGARVSRRHLQLVEEDGRYFVEQLSENPTVLIGAGEKRQVVGKMPLQIEHEHVIELTNSGTQLVFLQRQAHLDARSA